MLIEENLKEIFHTGKKLKNLDLFKDLLENKLQLLNKGKKKNEQEDYKIIKEIYQSIIKKNLLPFSLDRIERRLLDWIGLDLMEENFVFVVLWTCSHTVTQS